MTPIFAQMKRDEISPCLLGSHGSLKWVGVKGMTLLPKRSDVIDIDTKVYHDI
jgi:hypothetical protein